MEEQVLIGTFTEDIILVQIGLAVAVEYCRVYYEEALKCVHLRMGQLFVTWDVSNYDQHKS